MDFNAWSQAKTDHLNGFRETLKSTSKTRLTQCELDMETTNPYETPSTYKAVDANPKILIYSLATVFLAALLGALLGGGIGYLIGSIFPDYYETIFSRPRRPEVNAIAMGVGQGVTQGFVGGAAVGLVLVGLFYWYSTRMKAMLAAASNEIR